MEAQKTIVARVFLNSGEPLLDFMTWDLNGGDRRTRFTIALNASDAQLAGLLRQYAQMIVSENAAELAELGNQLPLPPAEPPTSGPHGPAKKRKGG